MVEIKNAIERYYPYINPALASAADNRNVDSLGFNPGNRLPRMTPEVREFFSASDLSYTSLGEYAGKRLALLNLMHNPSVRTTKTFASLVIVARAVRFIQETGERIIILTPSSANKATAMRDAVLRAIRLRLVTPEQLSVAVVVPKGSASKLWESDLNRDPELRVRNPVAVYPGSEPADVKTLARYVSDEHATALWEATGAHLWYTLDLNNYMAADIIRALAEADVFPATEPRLHVHAVSSAFGLLGHAQGRALLDKSLRDDSPHPHYFLVQHLGAPDMVLSLYHDDTSMGLLPEYRYDEGTGLFEQRSDPRFPYLTADPAETLDATFYTRKPATSSRMNDLIRTHGGGGIVVSLHECLMRYPQVRALLRPAGIELPADPRALREWSLVMAMTGLLNAVDRDLVPERDVLVHGSGCYSTSDYSPLSPTELYTVDNGDMLKDIVFKAAAA
ncbi:DUF6002 family protein [Streptomyces sp. NPDC007983]|uniref:DUF6002 family protein n=1 Tax=Streptomyces sp. NPDC007983 TaxID=3364800 RepID=UPI0036E01A95